MRLAPLLITLLFASGAAAQQADPLLPAKVSPVEPSVSDVPAGTKACTDRVRLVREARGLPQLERGPARPGEPLIIKAVDHRIDGCSVMVMHYDTRDVRPLPTEEGIARLERIPGQ